jgi:antitoxin ParD1/3/4
MGKNTSISLGEHFEEFIQAQLSTGRFSSTSEVIMAGLRLLEEEEKLKILRQALVAGEQSGTAEAFDNGEFKNKMHRKYLKEDA